MVVGQQYAQPVQPGDGLLAEGRIRTVDDVPGDDDEVRGLALVGQLGDVAEIAVQGGAGARQFGDLPASLAAVLRVDGGPERAAMVQVGDVVDAQHLRQVVRHHRVLRDGCPAQQAGRRGRRDLDAGRLPAVGSQLPALLPGEPVVEHLGQVVVPALGLVHRRPHQRRRVGAQFALFRGDMQQQLQQEGAAQPRRVDRADPLHHLGPPVGHPVRHPGDLLFTQRRRKQHVLRPVRPQVRQEQRVLVRGGQHDRDGAGVL